MVPKKAQWSSKRCLRKNEGGTLALQNYESLNNTCFKCTNKTLYIKAWQSEGWAQRRLLKFLSRELEQRLSLSAHLPITEGDLPKDFIGSLLLPKVLTVDIALVCPLWEQGPVRKHVHPALLWETPGEGLFPNLCELSNWKQHSRASLFMLFSVKILENQNKSEACWHWIMSE